MAVLAVMAFVNDRAPTHVPIHLGWIAMWVLWIICMAKSASTLVDKLENVANG